MQNWLDREFRVVGKCLGCNIKCPFVDLKGKWFGSREEAAKAWNLWAKEDCGTATAKQNGVGEE